MFCKFVYIKLFVLQIYIYKIIYVAICLQICIINYVQYFVHFIISNNFLIITLVIRMGDSCILSIW